MIFGKLHSIKMNKTRKPAHKIDISATIVKDRNYWFLKSITSVNKLNEDISCYETPCDNILVNSTRIWYVSTCNILPRQGKWRPRHYIKTKMLYQPVMLSPCFMKPNGNFKCKSKIIFSCKRNKNSGLLVHNGLTAVPTLTYVVAFHTQIIPTSRIRYHNFI